MPVGMTILAHAAGPERMGRVMALVGVPMLLAPALGPVVGGALLDGASWRLIFFINLPIAALALVARRARAAARRDRARRARSTCSGSRCSRPAWPRSSPGSPRPPAAARARVWLLAGARADRRRSSCTRGAPSTPLIDVRHLHATASSPPRPRRRCCSAPRSSARCCCSRSTTSSRATSARSTPGSCSAAQGVGAMLTMPVAGKLTDRIGAGPVVRVGRRARRARHAPVRVRGRRRAGLAARAPACSCAAPGMGATLMPAMAAAYQALPEAAVARAASALEIVQRAGATLGIALLAVILQHGLGDARLPRRARRRRRAAAATPRRRPHVHVGARPDRARARPGAAAPPAPAAARCAPGCSGSGLRAPARRPRAPRVSGSTLIASR